MKILGQDWEGHKEDTGERRKGEPATNPVNPFTPGFKIAAGYYMVKAGSFNIFVSDLVKLLCTCIDWMKKTSNSIKLMNIYLITN